MTTTAVLLGISSRQVTNATRRIVREVSGDRVPAHVVVPVVGVAALGAVVLLTVQAADVGRQLGSGFGPGLVASVLSVAGIALGMTTVIGSHMWADVTRREREALAVLPVGGWQLSLLAAVPALLPTMVALVAAAPSMLAVALTTRLSPVSVLGALATGLAIPLFLAAFWTLPMVALRPRRDLVVVVWVAVSVGALGAHAFWAASRSEPLPRVSRVNPLLWILKKPDAYSVGELLAALAALVGSGVALLLLRRVRRGQVPRRRSTMTRAHSSPDSLTGLRVWGGLVRVIWRQSSLVSELGVAALLSSLVSFFAAILLGQDREVHGTTALLVATGFAALPLLGVRSALGPTYRLTQLGMRASDIRVGLVAAAAAFFGIPLLPGVALLVWRGVAPRHFVVLAALAVIAFGIVLSCGSLLRRITATSLGRTVGVGASMALFYGLLHLGLPSWGLSGVLAAAACTTTVLVVVLRSSITQSQVA